MSPPRCPQPRPRRLLRRRHGPLPPSQIFRRVRPHMVLLATPPAPPRLPHPHRRPPRRRKPTPGDSRVKWAGSLPAVGRHRHLRVTPRTDSRPTRSRPDHRRPRRQRPHRRPRAPTTRPRLPAVPRRPGASRATLPEVSRPRCPPAFPLPGWPQDSPPPTLPMPLPTRATSPRFGALRRLRWGQPVQMDNHLKEGDACRRRRRSAVVATGSWERCPPRCRVLSGTVALTRSWIETSRSWFSPMRRFTATTSWSRPVERCWSRISASSWSTTSSAPSPRSSSPSR